jgi:hypothetical protein
MEADFCIEALEEAGGQARPAGDLQHRSGQPVHVDRFAGVLLGNEIAISMDGKGEATRISS